MTDFFNIPELAIQTYESWSKLQVYVWDLNQVHLLPFLPPARINYKYPLCFAVQSSPLQEQCYQFEWKQVLPDIGKYPNGLVKRCHAGIIEWVVPLFLDHQVAIILYAGQRMGQLQSPVLLHDLAPPSSNLPWGNTEVLPAGVTSAESELYLEGLRQLAARLHLWLAEAQTIIGNPPRLTQQRDLITRRNFILNFIHAHHTQRPTLADLANQLHLSESRMAHVVREACGQTFGTLLAEARMRSAATLLRHSQLSVNDVAHQCGFGDPSHFHKLFKKKMGMTPIAFRRQRWQVERVQQDSQPSL